jgi:hypothetical protein
MAKETGITTTIKNRTTATGDWKVTQMCPDCALMNCSPFWAFINASPWASDSSADWKCCPRCGAEPEAIVARPTVSYWFEETITRVRWFFGLLPWESCERVAVRNHTKTEWRWLGEAPSCTRIKEYDKGITRFVMPD